MNTYPLVAHRGYCSSYPENTLESLRAALQCGAAAVEFDVQLSRDLIPLVCHDDDLWRTAGVEMSILHSDFEQLRQVSVGEPQRFADQYTPCQLPSLQEVVELLQGYPAATVFVELKIESILHFGSQLMNERVLQTIQPIQQRCVLISDDLSSLLEARERSQLPIGWIIHQWSEEDRQQAEQAGPDYLVVNHKYFPKHNAQLWPGPWQWVVYETSKVDKARALLEMGIQWVETNSICPMLQGMQQADTP